MSETNEKNYTKETEADKLCFPSSSILPSENDILDIENIPQKNSPNSIQEQYQNPMQIHNPFKLNLNYRLNSLLDDRSAWLVSKMLAESMQWNFDAVKFAMFAGKHPLTQFLIFIFQKYDFMRDFKIDILNLHKFCFLVESAYHSTNSYHNSVHALDCCQALHCFFNQSRFSDYIEPLEKMVCFLSAVTHDMDHPGVTQSFLISSKHHLAPLYNNKCILEKHHFSSAISCLKQSQLVDHLCKDVWDVAVTHISSLIKVTNIQIKRDFINEITDISKTRLLDYRNADCRIYMMKLLVCFADLSNTCRPWNICKKWCVLMCEEIYRQGIYEKEMAFKITQGCLKSIFQIECEFFNIDIFPSFDKIKQILSDRLTQEISQNLDYNYSKWKSEAERQIGSNPSSRTLFAAGYSLPHCAPRGHPFGLSTGEGYLTCDTVNPKRSTSLLDLRTYIRREEYDALFFVPHRSQLFLKLICSGKWIWHQYSLQTII